MHRISYHVYMALTLAVAATIVSGAGPVNLYQQTRFFLRAIAIPEAAAGTEAIDQYPGMTVPP